MGGLIDETPVFCGGKDSHNNRFDSCIAFGQITTFIKMKERRSESAIVVLNDTTLFIMGGWNEDSRLSSTEFITLDTATSVNGPTMPSGLSNACAVKYNHSHIYLTGGWDGISWQKEVWIFDTSSSSWNKGPRMNKGRGYHGCTVLNHEGSSWIVAAGGSSGGFGVEILDPKENKWVKGKFLIQFKSSTCIKDLQKKSK